MRCSLLVPGPAEHAFAVFTDELTDWWVTEYTGPARRRSPSWAWSRGPAACSTRSARTASARDWGRVLTWDPPRRLVFAWQLGPDRVPVPDPARASEVEVLFLPDGPERTRVELEHRHFDRHGEAAEGYRKALTAGWHELLTRYLATVSRRHRPGPH